jgi:rod shape-determining protein MreD
VRHVLVLEPLALQMPPREARGARAGREPPARERADARCDARARGLRMIMPRGSDQLLLPVNPFFIAFTLLLALGINLLPLGRHPALPDLLALVLVFWNVHQPRRVGVGVAFLFGLLMDVHDGALLGQHALAYTLLSYGAISHAPPAAVVRPGRAGAAGAAAVLRRAPGVAAVRMLAGGMFPGWELLLAPLFEALLWPVVTRCCSRRSAGARSGSESAAVTTGPTRDAELKDLEQRLDRFRGRCWRLRRLRAALLCAAGRAHGVPAGDAPRRPGHAGRDQPHRGVPIVPNRGRIVDRNGVVLATNYSAYTLEITPSQRSASWSR